ncbi:peptidylprolyl isomerase [Leucobacter sp. UCD-THU]|uniref:FKBP-type peptidyl-prolyl cis-trans isomerase n=1 Tax=Leucobacter sp. UCD-THU TaxID=1292023 RepID=UPI00037B72B7|nr:FKBP-type peptidyl-prolyl cis-trans isomerase [Leucobacter sp. UCD-THU]EYT56637.1 peptidylprolyl isomerase [Leucobacter sp. UCD-THU]
MKISSVLLPAAVAGALLMTGCTGGGGTGKDASGEACVPAGEASKSIAVKGGVGSDLEITSKTPVSADEMERSVLENGEGDVVKSGQTIAVAMSMFNGSDGASLQQFPESAVPFVEEQLMPWAYEGIRCATPGEQVALVAPYADVFGELKAEESGIEGLSEKDSIVVVMEFGEITEGEDATAGEPGTLEPDQLLKKAEGKEQQAPAGFPSVVLADDGAPTITVPEGAEPPSELSIATLIEGDGEEVQEGDRVYVNYRGVIWRTGEEFDSSWSRGEPIDFLAKEGPGGVIGGFARALVGQKVGSQIISVVPAEDGGYGAASLEQMGHQPDDTMIFVLDILGTVHADADSE